MGTRFGFGLTMLAFGRPGSHVNGRRALRCPFTETRCAHGGGFELSTCRKLLGRQEAAWLLLSSEWITAGDAQAIGLAWRLCEPAALLEVTYDYARRLGRPTRGGADVGKAAFERAGSGRACRRHQPGGWCSRRVRRGLPRPALRSHRDRLLETASLRPSLATVRMDCWPASSCATVCYMRSVTHREMRNSSGEIFACGGRRGVDPSDQQRAGGCRYRASADGDD